MKILSIKSFNIASLEGLNIIDFTQEPLKSAGIYAITGPTGSGKTTILDVLALALYEQTPRLQQASSLKIQDVQEETIGSNDVATLLRRGASDAYAEVEFMAIDGDIYRAGWSVRRARNKKDGAIQPSKNYLLNITRN